MNNREQLEITSNYWIEKAEECLSSAKLEYSQGHLGFCVNRLYYAVFYAVSAVLGFRGIKHGKHSAVRASFHRHFIKVEVVPVEFGKLYDRLFYDRQEADYVAFVNFEPTVVKEQ